MIIIKIYCLNKKVIMEQKFVIKPVRNVDKMIHRFNNFIETANLNRNKYQQEGLEWCLMHEMNNQGGIIADEMGLGKTILSLGLMVSNVKKRTLIVLPSILVNQWVSIIKSKLNTEPLIYYGVNRHRITKEKLIESKIVVTTYGVVAQIDTERKNKSLNNENHLVDIEWNRIIFDEAHHMRNRKTKKYLSSQKLKSSIKWCITGTPIQNRINDVISLFTILNYDRKYVMKNIDTLIEEKILRRKKKEVGIILPKLNIINVNVTWKSEEEKELNKHFDFNNTEETKLKSYLCSSHLTQYLRGRQICISPMLLKYKIQELIDDKLINEDYIKLFNNNSKINGVVDVIKRNNNNNRKIIFCHFNEEMYLLYDKLTYNKYYDESEISILNGSNGINERKKILNNSQIKVLIIQIQTGCEGLNLQEYNEIYFVSPSWNPSVEDQAIARCHRYGQKKDVNVYRFYMENLKNQTNMDNYINNTQTDKRKIMEIID